MARAFGGIAARNGATLNSNSISSVATRTPNASGTIAGDIADRSLGNYMPQMQGFQLQGTQITGGHISTTATSPDGKQSAVDMYSAAQFEKPDAPHSVVTASDGSQWYQMASGEGRGAFYDAPVFNGMSADVPQGAGSPVGDGGPMDPAGAGVPTSGGDTAHLDPSGVDGTPISVSSDAPQIVGDSGDISVPSTTVVAGGAEVIDGTPMDVNIPDGGVVATGVAAGEDFPEAPQSGGFVAGVPYHGEETMDGSGGYGPADGGSGFYSEAPLVAATFPSAPEGTALRTVDEGVIEASSPAGGNTLWYNSAYFQEPDAPHSVIQSANGVDWYAMQQHADVPQFEAGDAAESYNQATFQQFMPGYGEQVYQVDGSHRQDGHFEVRNEDGSGTRFYDTAQYAAPRGDYQVFEDAQGSQWYAIRGEAAVERRPVYEQGHAVYDGDKLRTETVETVRYKQTPAKYSAPEKRGDIERKPQRRKQ